ncbi:hypothetical protein A3Q56_00540 [Intoshia linei]|uniref:Uncharacterized protein n=1 Tax=Intoshia linei TaxID=1819745 RepID=A0A177BDS3_9BILA|nr:hypothetical protein A3Q56_00540 [Intoshia linei]
MKLKRPGEFETISRKPIRFMKYMYNIMGQCQCTHTGQHQDHELSPIFNLVVTNCPHCNVVVVCVITKCSCKHERSDDFEEVIKHFMNRRVINFVRGDEISYHNVSECHKKMKVAETVNNVASETSISDSNLNQTHNEHNYQDEAELDTDSDVECETSITGSSQYETYNGNSDQDVHDDDGFTSSFEMENFGVFNDTIDNLYRLDFINIEDLEYLDIETSNQLRIQISNELHTWNKCLYDAHNIEYQKTKLFFKYVYCLKFNE